MLSFCLLQKIKPPQKGVPCKGFFIHNKSVAHYTSLKVKCSVLFLSTKNWNILVIFLALWLKVICKFLAWYFNLRLKLYYICHNFPERENKTLRSKISLLTQLAFATLGYTVYCVNNITFGHKAKNITKLFNYSVVKIKPTIFRFLRSIVGYTFVIA